jgi:Raf kinase inhibitor-like YbhB/YbcL family protein
MFTISSPAFTSGDTIPVKFSQEGGNVSPALEWHHAPGGTMEFVLICEDPDAPTDEPYVHWLAYGIDPVTDHFPEGLLKTDVIQVPHVLQGVNSDGEYGYTGPMPPKGHGWHNYRFQLYAVSEPLKLKPGLDVHSLRRAMDGKILDEALLIGRYIRGPEPKKEKAPDIYPELESEPEF